MTKWEQMILARGGGGHGSGGHRGGGGGPRHFGGGRGSHRSFHGRGHRGFSHYYNQYYRGFRYNPLWAAYPWYRYYYNYPPYSPFWYLLSLYPVGHPFWNSFGYYPPNDPYWVQYEAAVPYQSQQPLNALNSALSLTSSNKTSTTTTLDTIKEQPVTFVMNAPRQQEQQWVIGDSAMQHLKQGVLLKKLQLSPSLWNALVLMAENTSQCDWIGNNNNNDAIEKQQLGYQMKLGASNNAKEYALVQYGTESVKAEARDPHQYNAMDMRSLLNAVQGATQADRVEGTRVLFHKATQKEGRESGTLVMASGRVYRYRVSSGDATLAEKLSQADRVKGVRVSRQALEQMTQVANKLVDAPFSISDVPSGHGTKHATSLILSYASVAQPCLVMAQGRIQQHYQEAYDMGLAYEFQSLYRDWVG